MNLKEWEITGFENSACSIIEGDFIEIEKGLNDKGKISKQFSLEKGKYLLRGNIKYEASLNDNEIEEDELILYIVAYSKKTTIHEVYLNYVEFRKNSNWVNFEIPDIIIPGNNEFVILLEIVAQGKAMKLLLGNFEFVKVTEKNFYIKHGDKIAGGISNSKLVTTLPDVKGPELNLLEEYKEGKTFLHTSKYWYNDDKKILSFPTEDTFEVLLNRSIISQPKKAVRYDKYMQNQEEPLEIIIESIGYPIYLGKNTAILENPETKTPLKFFHNGIDYTQEVFYLSAEGEGTERLKIKVKLNENLLGMKGATFYAGDLPIYVNRLFGENEAVCKVRIDFYFSSNGGND